MGTISSEYILDLPQSNFYVRVAKPLTTVRESDKTTARLLSASEKFYEDIENIRKSLSLKVDRNLQKLWTDEDAPKYTDLALYPPIHGDVSHNLVSSVRELRRKYKLSRKWYMPLMTLAVSDVLVVPRTETTISVKAKHSETYDSTEPVLTIEQSEQISFNKFITTLDERRDEIEAALARLPKQRESRASDALLHWGHIVWFLKDVEGLTWTQIEEKAGDYGEAPYLDEMKNSYKRFKKYMADMGF